MRGRLLAWRATRWWQAARYWQERGDLDEAAWHADRAVRLARRSPALPVERAAGILLTAAEIDQDRDEHPTSAGHLAAARAVLESGPAGPSRDRLLARVLTGLGDLHRRAGRYPEAESTLDHARRLAGDGPDAAAVCMLLGIVAKELGGYDLAERHYADVARIVDAHGAPAGVAATLEHNLAGLAHARGRYRDAEQHACRAAELRRGLQRHDVALATDLAVLAAALAGQRRYAEARNYLLEATAICAAARPPRRYEIAVHTHTLAGIAQEESRHDEAERLYRRAMRLKEVLLGPDHPEIGLVANNLATLLHERDRQAEADRLYRRALAITEGALPAGHPVIEAIRANLTASGTAPMDGW